MKRPTTVWEVVLEVEVNYTMDFNSMQKFGKTKRFEVASSHTLFNNGSLLKRIVAYENECFSTTDNEAPRHFQNSKLHKIMITVRWSALGLTHPSFLNPDVTINRQIYGCNSYLVGV